MKLWAAFVALALGVIATLALIVWLHDPFGHAEIEAKLALGLREREVIARLGVEPALVFERDAAPTNYYIDGWSRRERPITNRVLIFRLGEPICYVWIDAEGRVEDYFVGGS